MQVTGIDAAFSNDISSGNGITREVTAITWLDWPPFCIAPTYYSERGEDCPPKISESITEFLDQTEYTDGEYAYLFDDGEWTCYDIAQYNDGVKGRILDIPADFPARMAFQYATSITGTSEVVSRCKTAIIHLLRDRWFHSPD